MPTSSRLDTLSDLLILLVHTNAAIRLHNRATDDCLPTIPDLTISALAAISDDDFPRLAERTRTTLSNALALAEHQSPILNIHHE